MGRIFDFLQRFLPVTRRVDLPTYTADITGPIERMDARDIVFARTDLFTRFGKDTPKFKDYYARHPELLEIDSKLNEGRGIDLGRGGVDNAMFAAQFHTMDKISYDDVVDGDPSPNKVDIPPERAAEKVKAMARFLGAGTVGIGPLKQEWVYSHVGRSWGDKEGFQPVGEPIVLDHPNAIAMTFKMDYDLIQSAPDFPTLIATAKGYADGAWVSIQLAEYIRMMGYSARAHHFHNYQVLVVPVAVDCGVGELSRAGYLMNKEYGAGLRLAVVTTDMPLTHDKPVDISVQSFCDTCKLCAESCPIDAIPYGDKEEHNGVKRWKLDAEKCYRYWKAVGTDCGTCMSACPWTKPENWLHKMLVSLAGIKGPHQRIMTQADKLFYGKFKTKPRPAFVDEKTMRNGNGK
jgi:reductive dehalogenase